MVGDPLAWIDLGGICLGEGKDLVPCGGDPLSPSHLQVRVSEAFLDFLPVAGGDLLEGILVMF